MNRCHVVVAACVFVSLLASAGAKADNSPNVARRRQQLLAVRQEIVALRVRVQKKMDDLPDAANTLKAVEADLKARQEALEKQIAALDAAAAPPEPTSTPPASGQPPQPPAAAAPSPFGRVINVSLDTRLGFDREDVILNASGTATPGRGVLRPEAVKATARRFVSSTVLRAESPLNRSASLAVTVPQLYQTIHVSVPGQPSRTLRANGLGDVSLSLEQRLPALAPGTNASITTGLQMPTGRSPFGLSEGELPTGEGFYQPFLRVGLQKVRVPLQFYGTLEYQTAFARRIAGQREHLPDSYGGLIGFSYTTGPEFTTQTSVSLRRSSSPVRFSPGTYEGYLSQALTFRPGGRDVYQGSVDVGLTNDSLDYWLGLSFRRGL